MSKSIVKKDENLLAIIRAGYYSFKSRVFAPREATLFTAGLLELLPGAARFDVTYEGFPKEAEIAFQSALDIWSVLLNTSVPIRVNACWKPLGEEILANARPNSHHRDFPSAPQAETWYPVSLANKLEGEDQTPGEPHIVTNFNADINWYFGIDANCPDTQFDLVTIVLHEIAHGLGYFSSIFGETFSGTASWGGEYELEKFPYSYDRFLKNSQNQQLINTDLFPNPSAELFRQITSNLINFDGAEVRAVHNNSPARLYAPFVWAAGASISHLDECTYIPGGQDSLMTPIIALGEAIHDPGLGLYVLKDLGW